MHAAAAAESDDALRAELAEKSERLATLQAENDRLDALMAAAPPPPPPEKGDAALTSARARISELEETLRQRTAEHAADLEALARAKRAALASGRALESERQVGGRLYLNVT